MNIGIDARFYGSIGKGLGRYTQKLIEHLEAIDQKNRYVVFLRKENFEEYQPKSANFQKVLADYQWYSFEEQFLFPRLLKRYHFDLMHFPHFNIPFLYRGKFMVTIHDLILVHFPTQRATTLHPLWYRLKFLAYKFVIRWAVTRSCHIMTVSEYTKQDILRHYAVLPEKITVSYEAADPFCFSYSHDRSLEILKHYGLTTSVSDDGNHGIIRPYLLYVGNAYPHKNLDALIEVLNGEDMRDIFLVLVGKEDYFYKRLKDAVRERGMKNILFAGFVPDSELDVLYRFGRAYVFPSLYEGFGLPPLEAMTRGLPVLATHATSLPEILKDAAMYFYPDRKNSLKEAVRHIWDSSGLRDDLRSKGYVRAGMFQWGRMAQETLKAYDQIMTKNQDPITK